ncbi:MAG: sigma 54-interacting transcriptional regulator [Bryobacterales bacterium]|nr:sigma 54-interacting transcriptional regulator [Acidobacteriota bacterium]MCB9385904.1 sigma 54-interacting transcriptional regulator [Bryobacterales bacterium]
MTPARIMIVEDEQITATDIEDILTQLGHDVTAVATSGSVAVSKADEDRPDLVLMDIHLKGEMDGAEAALEIRRRFGVPSIFLTAHADDETLERAKLAEPLGYIVKPFHETELQAAIQMAMHRRTLDSERVDLAEELASTLDALEDGVIRCDQLGRVTYLNAEAEKWTGWRLAESRMRPLSEIFRLLSGKNGAPMEIFLRDAVHGRRVIQFPQGCRVRSRDGVERDAAIHCAPVRDGSGASGGAVLVFGNPDRRVPAQEAAPGRPHNSESPVDQEMVIASQSMRDLMGFSARIASSRVGAILVLGESGVGKDVLARYLHSHSRRGDAPFLAVNCAAIPETLLESELFGYEKGAFTDARAQKKGVFDLAHGGTVFLDEIGELQPHIQAKLLRVLEDQTFRRLGGVRDVSVDLRIITATNRNLAQAVEDKSFREDLYYRLNVITISIPPIRERKEDILPLVEFFIRLYNKRFEREVQGVTEETRKLLLAHDWPGNVREIRNAIERAMVLEESDHLQPESLSLESRVSAAAAVAVAPGAASLEEVERSMLVQALEKADGNQTRAAEMLGISRDTLRYRIKKYNLR